MKFDKCPLCGHKKFRRYPKTMKEKWEPEELSFKAGLRYCTKCKIVLLEDSNA